MIINVYDLNESEKINYKDLIPEDLFKDKHINYLGAVDENSVVAGVLCYRLTGVAVEIVQVNVYTDLKNLGIEDALVQELVRRVKNSASLYQIMSIYPLTEEYEALDKALRKFEDFTFVEGDSVYYVNPKERAASSILMKLRNTSSLCNKFSGIDTKLKNIFYKYLTEHQIDFFNREDEKYLIDDLSVCYVDKKTRTVTSCIFCTKHDDGEIELAYMMIIPGHEKDMAALLSYVAERMEELFPDELLTINTVSKESASMVEKLFGKNCRKDTLCTAIRL